MRAEHTMSITSNQTYNVLIIEDLPSWQKSFQRYLQHEPLNLFFAASYFEAVQKAKLFPFDLVILDVNLTGVPYNVDGLTLAEHLWEWNQNLKVIIVTGSREWDQRLTMYRFTPSFILEKKNLDQDDLISKIYQTLC